MTFSRNSSDVALDFVRQKRYYEAQITTARDMWAYFEQVAAKNAAETEASRRKLVRLRKGHKALSVEADRLREEYQDLVVRFEALDAQLKQVLTSRTWQVMEPVRIVGRRVRKLMRWTGSPAR